MPWIWCGVAHTQRQPVDLLILPDLPARLGTASSEVSWICRVDALVPDGCLVWREKEKRWEALIFLHLRKLRLSVKSACGSTASRLWAGICLGSRLKVPFYFWGLAFTPELCVPRGEPAISLMVFFFFLLLAYSVPLGAKPCPRCQGNKGSETWWEREREDRHRPKTGWRAAASSGECPPRWVPGTSAGLVKPARAQACGLRACPWILQLTNE